VSFFCRSDVVGVPLQLEDFLPVMKLYDLLYPETEPLPLPNIKSSSCTFKMAVTSIWIHLSKKAQNERLQRPIPHALSTHIEYEYQQMITIDNVDTSGRDVLMRHRR